MTPAPNVREGGSKLGSGFLGVNREIIGFFKKIAFKRSFARFLAVSPIHDPRVFLGGVHHAP